MKHHIVLISFDALRADRLGCYGYSLDGEGVGNGRDRSSSSNHRCGGRRSAGGGGGVSLTANLDRIAAQGLIFRNATSPTTWTVPGHMTMLSGLEPLVHGCVSARHRYPPKELPFPLIFEMLAAADYDILAVTGGGYMEPQFGFGRGVERFEIVPAIGEAFALAANHATSADLTFSFIHNYAVHDYPRIGSRTDIQREIGACDPRYSGLFPRDKDFHALVSALGSSADLPPITPSDVAWANSAYNAATRQADMALGGFTLALQELGVLDETTLIVTADHGESLGDIHGGRQYWHHGGPPYEEQLRVPLLILPARHLFSLMEPTQLEERVSLMDIVPTILDLAEVSYARDDFDGSSLLDLSLGQVAAFETRRLFFHSCEDNENRYLDPRLFGSALSWRETGKLIYNPRGFGPREYYLLDSDPRESQNRIDDLEQQELRRIGEVIAAYHEEVARRAHTPPAEVIDDPVVLERLAALGYIDL